MEDESGRPSAGAQRQPRQSLKEDRTPRESFAGKRALRDSFDTARDASPAEDDVHREARVVLCTFGTLTDLAPIPVAH